MSILFILMPVSWDPAKFTPLHLKKFHLKILEESKRNSVIVELSKKDGGTLGLIISGGSDKGTRPRIFSLRPGSIAHRCDCLVVGDYIASVNGIQTCKLKHDEIVSLLKNAGDIVTLELEYEIPSFSEGPLCVCPKVIQLTLEKENNSFGFTLRGGACNDKLKCRPLTITHVRSGGPANREGSIKSGDRLLAIDGINLTCATLQEALNVIRQISDDAIFTIEYDVSIIDAVRNAAGPLLVEIEKTAGSQLGLSLTRLMLPDPVIVIESIRQASIAERCGALHVGDHVLAIDGIPVDLMTAAEAMQQLKSSPNDTVKLEILPVSQLLPHRVPDAHINRSGTIPHYVAARASFINSCYNTLSSLGSSIGPVFQFSSVSSPLPQESWNRNSVSPANKLPQSIGHADTTEVIIGTSHHGCGLSIQMKCFGSDVQSNYPFISSIESGSPADNSSVLHVGDRILAINGTSVQGLATDEVTQMLMHSYPKLLLKIEFDVAESVVPSSGTFVVKLVKRNECGLGITLTAPKNRQIGDPLIISVVEKGSVAHRSGTIQPGDKLLAVDLVRMENCTVEDALTVLHSSSEIVTLRIRKDETFSDDPDATSTIVYTVELLRHGGPLGITLSGTEEPFDPILISGLTENGLAEKTGALHVGDRILAINGICLRGKPLSEAILILQSCGDKVMLKISRNPNSGKLDGKEMPADCTHCEPESPLKSFTTPLPSVDSAVESWDSCNLDLCNGNRSECKSCDCSSSKMRHLCSDICQPSTSGQPKDQLGHDSWDVRTQSAQSMQRYSRSLSPSDDGHENWTKVLGDLQTCGQSQLLRQIEYKILGEANNELPEYPINSVKSFNSDKNSKCLSDTLSEQSLLELNAQIEQLQTGLDNRTLEESKSNCDESSCNHDYLNQFVAENSVHNTYQQYSSAFPMPLPVEIHKVTLFKDQVYEDFGFSISDGLYDHGVYINRIRAGGPADLSGLIKPYDRILQVNDVKTYDHDCCLTVPLIAASGDRIELLISRPAYDNEPSESACRRICGHLPWSDYTNRSCSRSPLPYSSKPQTLTKTL